MPAVSLSIFGGVGAQFFDSNGVILTGGKIFTYEAGTTTLNRSQLRLRIHHGA